MTCCKLCKCRGSEESDDETELPPGIIPVVPSEHDEHEHDSSPNSSGSSKNTIELRERKPAHTVVRMQFFAMTGWNLAIYPSKRVRGTREHYSAFAMLDVHAVRKGEIQMRGVETGLFLAMNRSGKLYGESDGTRDNTVWVETLSVSYYNYINKKYAHRGWYMGLKRSGKPKTAHRTKYGQKAIKFLHRHPYPIT